MSRARELCRKMGEAPQLFATIYGLWIYYTVAGKLDTARELAEQAVRMAQAAQDPVMLMGAHYALGCTLQLLGQITAAQEHMDNSLLFHDPKLGRTYIPLFGTDPGTDCISQSSRVLWLLGYPDRSLEMVGRARDMAQETGNPHSMAVALMFTAGVHYWRREVQETLDWGKSCVEYCTNHSQVQERLWVTPVLGWAMAEQGQVEEGITMIQECLAVLKAQGAEIVLPHILATLAEIQNK